MKKSNSNAALLQVQIRDTTSGGGNENHFVRLAPNTATQLHDLAINELSLYENKNDERHLLTIATNNDRRWYICNESKQSSRCDSGIEFLPLAITFSNNKTIYASYNGGNIDYISTSSSSITIHNKGNLENYIDIPNKLLINNQCLDERLHNDDNVVVSVRSLVYIESIFDLYVEPVTTDDWELLQLYPLALLEDGTFLQQISVVYSGQIIELLLPVSSNKTRVRLMVLPRNFEDVNSYGTCTWPLGSTKQLETYPCCRLLAETQIVISPKERRSLLEYPLQLMATKQDYNIVDPCILEISDQLNVELLSVEQGSLLVHPNTLSLIRSASGTIASDQTHEVLATIAGTANDDNTEMIITVRVIESLKVPENHAALHPLSRTQISAPLFSSVPAQIFIKKLLSPIEIGKYSSIVPDLVNSGEAKIIVRPIRLSTIQRKSNSWYTPNITHFNLYRNPTNTNSTQGRVDLTLDFLINVGSIVTFSSSMDCFYRIDVKTSENCTVDTKNGFIYSTQLYELCNLDAKGDEKTEFVAFESSNLQCYLLSLLPAYPVFLSSTLRLAKSALLRPSVLVCGARGSGKTFTSLLISAIERINNGHRCLYLDCRKLRDTWTIRMKTILTELSKIFDEANVLAPCNIILDELDLIAPNINTRGNLADNSSSQMHDVNPAEVDQSKLVTDLIRSLMLKRKDNVFVIATTLSSQSISHQLMTEREFSYHIDVDELDGSERDELYKTFIRQFSAFGTKNWTCSSSFTRKTSGFTPSDIARVAFQVNSLQLTRPNYASWNQTTFEVLENYVPLSRLESLNESISIHTSNLSEMGGLHKVKAELVSTIVKPLQYRRIYSRTQVRLPHGVLLFGFPGTGKSMSVEALAKEYGYPLISCRGPEILDKYIGASEAKVRALFARAGAVSPSILFLDELDALAPRRGSDNTGVTDRIVNQLLTFLDGVENVPASKNGPVYVVCATSRPDKVDPALLRPGRLEKHIYFGLSENIEEVKDLVSKISARYSIDPALQDAISSGTLVEKVSKSNPSFRLFSAADISSMFLTAQLLAVHRSLDLNCTDEVAVIQYDNLFEAMTNARPSVTDEDYVRLSEIYNSYRQDTIMPSSNKVVSIQSTVLR